MYIEEDTSQEDIITEEGATRTPYNYFKCLKGKYEGEIVSISDVEMIPPIIGMKPPKGNRPDERQKPIYGNPLDKLLQFSYSIDKAGAEFGCFLLPNTYITTIYKNPKFIYEKMV